MTQDDSKIHINTQVLVLVLNSDFLIGWPKAICSLWLFPWVGLVEYFLIYGKREVLLSNIINKRGLIAADVW